MYKLVLAMLLGVAITAGCGETSPAPSPSASTSATSAGTSAASTSPASASAASPSAASSSAAPAAAQNFPTRTITLVSSQTAGSTIDLEARILAPELSKALGATVEVVDKTGAQNLVGVQFVAKDQPPDGYTVLIASSLTMDSLPITVKDLPFDAVKDLVPVIAVGSTSLVLMSPSSAPWKTFGEYVTYVKANPGKTSYSSASSATRLLTEMVIRPLGMNVTYVPFSDTASATAAVVGGQVQLTIQTSELASAQGDKVRILTQAGDKRIDKLPNVPTNVEAGAPPIPSPTNVLYVRAGTPRPVIDKLHDSIAKIIQDTPVIDQLKKTGVEPQRPPIPAVDALGQQMTQDAATIVKIGGEIGLKPQ